MLGGALLVEQKDFSAGIAVLSGALPVLSRVGSRQPEFQIALAKGLAGTGDLTRALDVLGAALTHAKSDGEYWCVPVAAHSERDFDHPGSKWERRGRAATAGCVAAARKQGARSWELRTATSLAQYLKSRGDRRHESHTVLESVVDQFTEGFATTDLLTARKWLANHR
jgi:predicted ATPase